MNEPSYDDHLDGLRAHGRCRMFSVQGVPGPQGSKRHVGNGVMIEQSKKVKPWRKAVREAAESEEPPLTGPLAIDVAFYMVRGKTVTRPRPHVRGADLDKLLRSTFDALTDEQVWKDDAQVVRVTADKFYAVGESFPAGAAIVVWEV